MVSLHPPCTVVADAAELPRHSEVELVEQHLGKQGSRALHWEELPMASAQKSHVERSIQWEELPRSTEERNETTKMAIPVPPSHTGAAVMMDIKYETTTEAEIYCAATGKQPHDIQSTGNKSCTVTETVTTECAPRLEGQADLFEETVNLNSFNPSEQFMPHYAKPETDYKQSTFSEAFPVMTEIAGIPDSKDWNSIHQPMWERQIKQESVLIPETHKQAEDMKGVATFAQTSPRESRIFGFPSVPEAGMNNAGMTSMASLSNACSKVSQILGFPSSHTLKDWRVSKDPLFQPRMRQEQVSVIDLCKKDQRPIKAMISCVPACPQKPRTPGFPSHPQPLSVYSALHTVNLFTLGSQVSKIPGFPSVDGNMNLGWVTKEPPLLKTLSKNGVIVDIPTDKKTVMKNMLSCVPSCPKVSIIHGFPFIPNSQIVYYGFNVIHLFPLCSLCSTTPGFSSIEGNKKQWVVEVTSFMHKPEKNVMFSISSSPVKIDKPANMIRLVPTCPGQSKIHGFPSLPQYNMLHLVPICPKVSSFPGFASFEEASDFQWIADPPILSVKLPKETVFVIQSRNQEATRITWALAPSCPEASRIPGFPSAPHTKSKSGISFAQCCSTASSLKGFASLTTISSTDWLSRTKIILTKPQMEKAELNMAYGQYGYNIKGMLTLVTSCPKEARVQGFPSAQAVTRPPSMVSLYTAAPCVSLIPGCPSARALSFDWMNTQTWTTQRQTISEKPHTENVSLITSFSGKCKPKDDVNKYMIAMAPTCPHVTHTPGLPSTSQLSPTEKQRITKQELSPQSLREDTRNSVVTSGTCAEPAFGENLAKIKIIFTFLFLSSVFSFIDYFCFLVTEEKLKDGAKQKINLCVDSG